MDTERPEIPEKLIEEAFPELQIPEEMEPYLRTARIGRVVFARRANTLYVFLTGRQWIHRKYLERLEQEIARQLFPKCAMQVRIREQFHLSAQYTPERLMEAYRPSILHELKGRDVVLFHLFRTAELSFPEKDRLVISLEQSALAAEREQELLSFLREMYRSRFGMDVALQAEHHPRPRSPRSERAEIQMQEKARQILARAGYAVSSAPASAAGEAAAADTGESAESGAPANSGKETGRRERGRGKAAKNAERPLRYSDDPDLLYGRMFEDDSVPIESVDEMSNIVTVRGEILFAEGRALRNEKALLTFAVTDDTDTIRAKIFMQADQLPEMTKLLKEKSFIRMKGRLQVDPYEHELMMTSVIGIRKSVSFRTERADFSPEKRVELHCHTRMSDMDGISGAADLVKRAYRWGHPAIAITDHGVVQAFPDALHAMEDIDKDYRGAWQKEHPEASKDEVKKVCAPFKVIYGMEGYLADDEKGIAENSKGQLLSDPVVVFDLETTGLSNETCRIIEIGAVRVENGEITGRFSTFVNPEIPIPLRIEEITHIRDEMVMDAPKIAEALPAFLEFSEGAVMAAHNADFDMSFIQKECQRQGIEREFTWIDTVAMARMLLPGLSRFRLEVVAKALGVSLENHHRAVDDAECTAQIYLRLVSRLAEMQVFDLDTLNKQGCVSEHTIRKLPSHHIILLAATEEGRVNLYRLVSESHLHYFSGRQAKIPRSLIRRYREGLIVGSACVAGELYQALLRGAPDPEIARIVSFYDYLEIQPLKNNAFLIEDEKNDLVTSEEDLKALNRRIVKLGEQFGKPVAATGDVHFLDPQDEVYRRIIMSGRKFEDADQQAPLYLHTTEEMLEEFSYLGEEKAYEVVVTAPRRIAERCDRISPVRPDKCPPVIENSDRELREICYRKAHQMYGDTLPEIVEKRLERELNSIISNGYAVMYIIAQKLVWKSNEDGYLVGSRGSVGSSFAATMAGITEVNPLAPHYLCGKCHFVDFDSPEVQEYARRGESGCDMPDRVCPVCGEKLQKMGFNIPFETFLGFKGNKEPDIDLNFSGEYQSKAHKYTEVIFGAGQTFRAGTIGTLAEKTAYGYVKNYYEEKGIFKRNCEIDRIVKGCVGIRRTTGQHPGGIIVLPIGQDINSFTPVQHPADDMNTDIITTHFDYHSIDQNLLKLDILGHDDPTMIRMLEDLTGVDATTIPLDEPKVMSLFKSTEALGVRPEDIDGIRLGCLGVPEFGTDFAMQMLIDTQPRNFSDLSRIAGLAHGTDVWLGNAQTLIQEGKATISTAICTRDDIMTYLIGMGLDNEESFKIMEDVRKGKVAKGKCDKWPAYRADMEKHGVPDWYIWSCEKIKYMFPKAHAVAYVMMAYRIAWFKIYYPLAYYAAYFSIRASAFSYEKMCMGRARLEEHLRDYHAREDSLSEQEKNALKDMQSVLEMYARGFEFLPIDLYRAGAHRFRILDGKLMPSLDKIDGLGDKAADSVALAAREGGFLSREDFRSRAKVGKTISDTLVRLGILKDLPESNQISLFDMMDSDLV